MDVPAFGTAGAVKGCISTQSVGTIKKSVRLEGLRNLCTELKCSGLVCSSLAKIQLATQVVKPGRKVTGLAASQPDCGIMTHRRFSLVAFFENYEMTNGLRI